ncbi:hypothetical protein IE53DRAFT_386296 [Violaceomyces palustris]|uniref:Uncharacterized protein n=1 Tax=Violaceomyces palustris TaxID=1673888 RepID=A0ACD0NZY6_9BASI|nr:hypothetical protein IE53DRAFT_386296 [Violaceomyces palustris]
MAAPHRTTLACSRCLRIASSSSSSSSSHSSTSNLASSSRSAPFSTCSPSRSTSVRDATESASPKPDSSDAVPRGRRSAGRGQPRMLPPFPQWMATSAEQYKYPKPGMGPNWIGSTPFPLNPAFNPPPPLRQSVKDEIWAQHTSNPARWTVRALSEKFNIGLVRMEAVLRLKALENEFKEQQKPLQTDFQQNMDRLLGARTQNAREFDPAVQSKDSSNRGPQHEEFDEADSLDTPSVIAPALAEANKVRQSMITALPDGGPAIKTMSQPRTVASSSPSSPSKSRIRPTIRIVNVGGDSYEGAGRLKRNQKRAEKRSVERKKYSKGGQSSEKGKKVVEEAVAP